MKKLNSFLLIFITFIFVVTSCVTPNTVKEKSFLTKSSIEQQNNNFENLKEIISNADNKPKITFSSQNINFIETTGFSIKQASTVSISGIDLTYDPETGSNITISQASGAHITAKIKITFANAPINYDVNGNPQSISPFVVLSIEKVTTLIIENSPIRSSGKNARPFLN